MEGKKPQKTADDRRIEKLLKEYINGDVLCPKCGTHMMSTKEGAGAKYGICENCYHDAHFKAMADNYRQKIQEREYQREKKRYQRACARDKKKMPPKKKTVKAEELKGNIDERYYL